MLHGADIENGYVSGKSISSTAATDTVNGTGVDFRSCGKEVTAIFSVGPNNPGDDTTVDWKLQESSDNSTFTDISGATGTQVGGDATGFEVKTFATRAQRYVRAVATLGGSSEAVDLQAYLLCPKANIPQT